MPRYIDADALKDEYEQMLPDIGDGYHKETLQDVLFELEHAPTISPDEVRGVGKWIKNYDRVKWWYECSCCHEKPLISRFGDMEILSTYCPSCGAKMKGAEENHTMDEFMYGQEMGSHSDGSL